MKTGLPKGFECAAGLVIVLTTIAARGENARLHMSWSEASHPSGVYHAAEAGTLAVVVENTTAEGRELKAVEFGIQGVGARGGEGFKVVSVTPVNATVVKAGERVKIPLAVTFAGAGTYQLRWVAEGKAVPIGNEAGGGEGGETLECIFAPRGVTGGGGARWLGVLPKQAARVPGYLADLAAQTDVRRYLLDERFAFDAATGVTLGVGAGLGVSTEQVDALFAEAASAKVGIVLRVTVPMNGAVDPRAVEAFHQYVADAVKRGRGALAAIAIVPEGAGGGVERATYRAFYLAGYSAANGGGEGGAKVLMLGAGTAQATSDFLLKDGLGLSTYVDAVAVTDASGQPAVIAGISKLPVWVLPPPGESIPAAVGLAEGAAVVEVPPAAVDHGATEHLLGGAAFYQKLHGPAEAPYVAAFQGDGYAVAAIAGFSAGTPLDAAWPMLAKTRTVVSPVAGDPKRAYGNIEVGDDSGSMRVVDAAGAPVDCRDWDTLYVPVEGRVVYILQGGTAEDLMASLRSARTHDLPVMAVGLAVGADAASATVALTNLTQGAVAGICRVVQVGAKGGVVVGSARFAAVAAGQKAEVPVALTMPLVGEETVIVEIVTDGSGGGEGVVQRTVVRWGDDKVTR
jgi:hypothetical protein